MEPKLLLQHSGAFFTLSLKGGLFLLLFIYSPQNLFAQPGKLIFSDDFSQNTIGSNWQADQTWSIGNGVAYNNDDYGALLTTQSFSSNSYIIETAVLGFSNAYWRQFLFTFGQAGAAGPESPTYVLKYTPDRGGYLTLTRATDNIYYPDTLLDGVSIYPDLERARWYKFKIAKYQSGLIQVYLDKGAGYSPLPLLETIDSTYQQLGHFGWTLTTETASEGFLIDGVEVRTPTVEKPPVPEIPAGDNLISRVLANSNKLYSIGTLKVGAKPYTDRDYVVTSVPAYLQDASFVQTAMADKYRTPVNFLNIFLKRAVIVYVGYDPRATTLPAWLEDWEKTEDKIGTDDPDSNYLEIYRKYVRAWHLPSSQLLLGGNLASPAAGSRVNYLVAAVAAPPDATLQAEDAKIEGAQIRTNHVGYSGTGFVDFINKSNDYIEWNAQIKESDYYFLYLKFANGSAASRSLSMTIDEAAAGVHSFPAAGSWDNWQTAFINRIYLTKGTHKIRVRAIGSSGPNIDHLELYAAGFSASGNSVSSHYSLNKAPEKAGKFASVTGITAGAYPNPFANRATITYSLPEKAAVYVTLYNQQGQKMKVLVDKIQPAGNYTIEFDGANLPKGLYLYQLQTGNQAISGKIIRK